MCLIKLACESRNKSNAMTLPSFVDLFLDNSEQQLHIPVMKETSMTKFEREKVRKEGETLLFSST